MKSLINLTADVFQFIIGLSQILNTPPNATIYVATRAALTNKITFKAKQLPIARFVKINLRKFLKSGNACRHQPLEAP